MQSHITQKHRDVKNFKYDGLKGFWAFDYYVTEHEDFGLELRLGLFRPYKRNCYNFPTIEGEFMPKKIITTGN